jgi:hypothetical protein
MRPRLALACLAALALAGCGDSPVGLPTALDATILFEPTSGVQSPPALVVTEDAMVATTDGHVSACFADEATASRRGDVVVVMLTHRELDVICTTGIMPVTFRVEVRPLPAGATEARFYERLVDLGGTTVFQRELVQRGLTNR